MHELLAKLQTPDEVLERTVQQLDSILLISIAERINRGREDLTAPRYVSIIEIQGIYSASTGTFIRRNQADNVLTESWNRLIAEGFLMEAIGQSRGMMTLTSKGFEAAAGVNFEEIRARQMLRREMLHVDLRGTVYDNFAAGHYDTAILEAFKQVEVSVRLAAGLPSNLVGVKLMRDAFNANNGPLTDPSMPHGERDRMPDLFAGAIGVFKNPLSHRKIGNNDPIPVIEELMFASRLLRLITP